LKNSKRNWLAKAQTNRKWLMVAVNGIKVQDYVQSQSQIEPNFRMENWIESWKQLQEIWWDEIATRE